MLTAEGQLGFGSWVDAHCDTILRLYKQKRHLTDESSDGHLDLPRMQKGGIGLQFFAVWIEPIYKPDRALLQTLEVFEYFHAEMDRAADKIRWIRNQEDVFTFQKQGGPAALLAIEGGEPVVSLQILRMLFRLGLRALTLTWNERNAIADGAGEEGTRGGLSHFGKDVVLEMHRLGMVVDVSHIAEPGFWDVLSLSERPVIATHSNAKAIHPHRRNLTDEQLDALKKVGGVTGLNLYPPFVGSGAVGLEQLLAHVHHIVDRVGPNHLGLGADFDGINKTPLGFSDVTTMPRLAEALSAAGYKDEDVRKMMGENILRVLAQVLPREEI